MQTNPYLKGTGDYLIWQQGYEAGWNKTRGIVSNINWETDDLKSFERMILDAFGTLPKQENKSELGRL